MDAQSCPPVKKGKCSETKSIRVLRSCALLFLRSILTSSSLLLLLVSFGEVPGLTVILGPWMSAHFGMEAIAFSLFSSPTLSLNDFGLFMMLVAVGYQSIVTLGGQHKRTNSRDEEEAEGG
jgi:hypothetical protein